MINEIEDLIEKSLVTPQQASILRLLAADGHWLPTLHLIDESKAASLNSFTTQVCKMQRLLRRHGFKVERQCGYRLVRK